MSKVLDRDVRAALLSIPHERRWEFVEWVASLSPERAAEICGRAR